VWGPRHALLLDGIDRLTHAGGIDQRQREAADVCTLGQQIPRGSGNGGHNRAIGVQQRVEQARLADVRRADNRHLRAFANQAPAGRLRKQAVDSSVEAREHVARLLRRDEVIALVGKIKRRFEFRDHVEQLTFNLADRARQGAFQLIERGARLQRRDRVDEIGHCFCLNQIDLVVEKSAQCELARLCEPGAGADRRAHDATQHHRAAVCRDLDDVLTRVGGRRFEEGHHDAIADVGGRLSLIRPVAGRISRPDPGYPRERGSSWRERFCSTGEVTGDPLGVGAADTHHADSTAPGRRGDGDDGIGCGKHAGGMLHAGGA
jgi:hypothetical protein